MNVYVCVMCECVICVNMCVNMCVFVFVFVFVFGKEESELCDHLARALMIPCGHGALMFACRCARTETTAPFGW